MRLALLAALLLAPAVAQAEEPSSTPTPPEPLVAPAPSKAPLLMILAGSGLLAGGVVNGALAPLCVSSKVATYVHDQCLAVSIGFAAGLVAAGMPLLVLGVKRRQAPPPVVLSPVAGGAVLGGRWSW